MSANGDPWMCSPPRVMANAYVPEMTGANVARYVPSRRSTMDVGAITRRRRTATTEKTTARDERVSARVARVHGDGGGVPRGDARGAVADDETRRDARGRARVPRHDLRPGVIHPVRNLDAVQEHDELVPSRSRRLVRPTYTPCSSSHVTSATRPTGSSFPPAHQSRLENHGDDFAVDDVRRAMIGKRGGVARGDVRALAGVVSVRVSELHAEEGRHARLGDRPTPDTTEVAGTPSRGARPPRRPRRARDARPSPLASKSTLNSYRPASVGTNTASKYVLGGSVVVSSTAVSWNSRSYRLLTSRRRANHPWEDAVILRVAMRVHRAHARADRVAHARGLVAVESENVTRASAVGPAYTRTSVNPADAPQHPTPRVSPSTKFGLSSSGPSVTWKTCRPRRNRHRRGVRPVAVIHQVSVRVPGGAFAGARRSGAPSSVTLTYPNASSPGRTARFRPIGNPRTSGTPRPCPSPVAR